MGTISCSPSQISIGHIWSICGGEAAGPPLGYAQRFIHPRLLPLMDPQDNIEPGVPRVHWSSRDGGEHTELCGGISESLGLPTYTGIFFGYSMAWRPGNPGRGRCIPSICVQYLGGMCPSTFIQRLTHTSSIYINAYLAPHLTLKLIATLTRIAGYPDGAEGIVKSNLLNPVLDGLHSVTYSIRLSTCKLLRALVRDRSVVRDVLAVVPREHIFTLSRYGSHLFFLTKNLMFLPQGPGR
jgi:hypothetical protein